MLHITYNSKYVPVRILVGHNHSTDRHALQHVPCCFYSLLIIEENKPWRDAPEGVVIAESPRMGT
jgi:hypothetical protein